MEDLLSVHISSLMIIDLLKKMNIENMILHNKTVRSQEEILVKVR